MASLLLVFLSLLKQACIWHLFCLQEIDRGQKINKNLS